MSHTLNPVSGRELKTPKGKKDGTSDNVSVWAQKGRWARAFEKRVPTCPEALPSVIVGVLYIPTRLPAFPFSYWEGEGTHSAT